MAQQEELDVLVAEDNEINQKVISMILDQEALSYHIVDNGRSVIEAYRTMSPRLILMDISMCEVDGLEATRRIRALEADKDNHTPIIAHTANALRGDDRTCLDAGMDDYISKPVSADQLADMINMWLSRTTPQRMKS